jgi:hypothetical protein
LPLPDLGTLDESVEASVIEDRSTFSPRNLPTP